MTSAPPLVSTSQRYAGVTVQLSAPPNAIAALLTLVPRDAPDCPGAVWPEPSPPFLRVECRPYGWDVADNLCGEVEEFGIRGGLGALVTVMEPRLAMCATRGRSDQLELHAGAALTGAGVILGLGDSGSGKSTVTLAWGRSGLPILGDDVVLLDRHVRASAFPRLVKIHSDRAHEFGIDPETTPFHDPSDPEVWIDPGVHCAGFASGTHPVAGVVHLRYESGASVRIEPLDCVGTLQALLLGRETIPHLPVAWFDLLIRVAESAPGIRVVFGDAGAAASRILRHFGESE